MSRFDNWIIPDSWAWTAMEELGEVIAGGTPSTKEPEYWGGFINWISPSDLSGYSSKFISRGAKSLSEKGLLNSSAKIMPTGSVHFSSRAPIGYVVISADHMTTNQGFKSLVPARGVFN
jgi:type I restriction enzyme S subunit